MSILRSFRWRIAEWIAPGPIRGVVAEDDSEIALPRYEPSPPSPEVLEMWRERGIIGTIAYDALPRVLDRVLAFDGTSEQDSRRSLPRPGEARP